MGVQAADGESLAVTIGVGFDQPPLRQQDLGIRRASEQKCISFLGKKERQENLRARERESTDLVKEEEGVKGVEGSDLEEGGAVGGADAGDEEPSCDSARLGLFLFSSIG